METRVNELLRSSSNYLGNIKCDITPGTAPFKCAVDICKNKFISIESHQLSTFKFHNFPQNPILKQKWKALCNLPPNASTLGLKVCSDHFTLDDYGRNLKEELLNPGHKRSLKDFVLPSVNVSALTEEKLNDYVKCKAYTADNIFQSWQNDPDSQGNTKYHELCHEVLTLKSDIKSLERKIKYSKDAIKRKTCNLAESKKNLNKIDIQLRKRTRNVLHSFLSEAQINLLRGRKKVFWSDDDLAQAFSLRHMGGKEFYLYMKNTLNYPLPSLSCVQAWAGNN